MKRALQFFCLLAIGISFLAATCADAQWTPMNPVRKVQQESDGVIFTMGTGTLKLQVCSESIIRVLYSPTATFPKRTDFVVIKESWPEAAWSMEFGDDAFTLSTSSLKITVTKKDGAIAYAEANGTPLVQEASRSMRAEKVNGEDTYRAESFLNVYGSHEGLYGLGQHQSGVWNYRGESVDIAQDNSNISVPLMISSKGYGIFWNNMSRSRFNNRFANYLYISFGSCRRHRLLLSLRARVRQDHRRIPRADRTGSHVRQVGVRILAMQEPLQVAGRNPGSREEVSRAAHSCRQHRAGLVLVESQGRIRLQQELSRSERR